MAVATRDGQVDGVISLRARARNTPPRPKSNNAANTADESLEGWASNLVFALGGTNVSARELRSLPADPAKLKSHLSRLFAEPGNAGGDMPAKEAEWLFEVGAGMITDIPVTKGTRAAAYRMLAGLPGVKSIGRVKDTRGRTGDAVAMTHEMKDGVSENRLIIDPETGLALAEEIRYLEPRGDKAYLEPGRLWYSDVILEAGWTDTPPLGSG